MLDTHRGIETPEGVKLALRPAGLVPRFAAFAIDFGIRATIYLIAAQIAAIGGSMGLGLLLIAIFLLEWFYPVFFEVGLTGATPGKRVMGIAVVLDSGLPVTWGASVTRNLLRFADFLPLLYGFGILSMLSTAQFKRLGDLAAGTLVIYREKKTAARKLPEAPPVQIDAPLEVEAQLALISLAERSTRLTPERLDELVDLAMRLQAGSRPIEPSARRNRVFGMAQWLMGRR